MMTNDTFVEELRGSQAQEKGLSKHWGGYNAREVEQYVEKLLSRMANMEKMYQERYEEMRTGLLGMTRERDEQAVHIRMLEEQLEGVPEDWAAHLEEQGLIALPKVDYDKLREDNLSFQQRVDTLTRDQAKLIDELEVCRVAADQSEEFARQLEQAQTLLAAKELVIQQTVSDLKAQRRQQMKLQADFDAARLTGQEQLEALGQARVQYQALEVQHQLAKEMVQRLIDEKKRLEEDAVVLQQRSDAQKLSLIHRYQGVLRNQQQCLKQLQESFAASVHLMENLGEAGMKGFSSDSEE